MKKILTLLLAIFASNLLYAQSLDELSSLWQGLTTPQTELPVGNAAYQTPKRVEPKNIPTKLVESGDNEWIITDGWRMLDNDKMMEAGKSPLDPTLDISQWYNATVPGTVLTTLVNQGVYADPYFGLNNLSIPESLCRTEWWYRVNFDAPNSDSGKNKALLFNGINYRAVIYLNGKKLGEMKGAFIRGEFDVTNIIKDKDNSLTVHIYPPANPGIPSEQTMKLGQGLNGGMLSHDGPTFISSIGWDWIPGIRDRNIGIWQDVRLLSYGDVTIGDPLVVANLPLPDTSKADITVKVPIKNLSSKAVKGTLVAEIDNITVEHQYSLNANEQSEIVLTPKQYAQLTMQSPKLWWPNGYGEQYLYNLDLEVDVEGQKSDKRSLKFGVRELSYELMVATDEGNQRYAYTPADRNDNKEELFDYINRVEYQKDIDLPTLKSKDLSGLEKLDNQDPVGPYLVLRVNGTRIYCKGGNWGMDDAMKNTAKEHLEPYFKLHKDANFNIVRNWTGESTQESFYELCDQYGMLVWNDFWITTDDTVEPYDQELFLENARDVVRRFRNHPSIAIWNPRNEGFAPKGLDETIPQMMAQEDNSRHYHGQSRFLNMRSSGPWGYMADASKYYTQNAQGFNTELGTYAVPTANTIKKFIAEEDLWPINDVWAYHDLHHTTQNFPDFMAAVESFGKPNSMEEFAAQSQLICYDAWRNILEAWNSKMWNNTSGLILWMTHPAWPSMVWQTYSYDYETPGSYFGAMKACEPLHVQMNLPNDDVVVINTTRQEYKGMSVATTYYDLVGKKIYSETQSVDVAPNCLTKCYTPKSVENNIYLARVELKDSKGKLVSINDYIKKRDNSYNAEIAAISKAEVKLKKSGNKVLLTNGKSAMAIAVKLNAVDKSSGEIILPAYFSDGYFNLLPGEKREIEFDVPNSEEFEILVTGFNL